MWGLPCSKNDYKRHFDPCRAFFQYFNNKLLSKIAFPFNEHLLERWQDKGAILSKVELQRWGVSQEQNPGLFFINFSNFDDLSLSHNLMSYILVPNEDSGT